MRLSCTEVKKFFTNIFPYGKLAKVPAGEEAAGGINLCQDMELLRPCLRKGVYYLRRIGT